MSFVKFHHNSEQQFLFQTPEGITVNIPPGVEYVTDQKTAEFILEQVKSGGGSYTATDQSPTETFEFEPATTPEEPSSDEPSPLKTASEVLNESEA